MSSDDKSPSHDFIAGWLGGAIGILVSNPLEVLKVRLQTHSSSPATAKTPRVGAGSRTPSTPSTPSASATIANSAVQATKRPKPSLTGLWRAEGLRVFFAGAMGPILGLAFIDSAFFGGYGVAMNALNQDRQDPSSLARVFAAGAMSGATCALLQTPIEVVKCRAQIETLPRLVPSPTLSPALTPPPQKQGSYRIALRIAREQGLRGFYVGGLMTACHDGISSGVFFWGYFVFRRMLRGERPFQSSGVPDSTAARLEKLEVGRILLAGGLAGSLSAFVSYPFDIVKTRLQTTVASLTHPSTRSIIAQIQSEGHLATQYRYTSSLPYAFLSSFIFRPSPSARIVDGRAGAGGDPRAEKWARRIGAGGAFFKGLGPTVVGSFVGSAVTITVFEVALVLLGGDAGGLVGG